MILVCLRIGYKHHLRPLAACRLRFTTPVSILRRPVGHCLDLFTQSPGYVCRDREENAAVFRVLLRALTRYIYINNIRLVRSRILTHEHLLHALRQIIERILEDRKDVPTSRNVTIAELAGNHHFLFSPPDIVWLERKKMLVAIFLQQAFFLCVPTRVASQSSVAVVTGRRFWSWATSNVFRAHTLFR